jgi:hypothetical protein
LVVDLFIFDRFEHPERAVAAVAVVEDLEVVNNNDLPEPGCYFCTGIWGIGS